MICVVEDNQAIRETVKAYLELAGLEVREFPACAGVAESLAFKRPELFILDVMLPDGSGFALAKRIREIDPRAAFIFLTARESESDRVTGFELGAEDYVVKPFSPKELTLRVRAVLRRLGAEPSGAGSSAAAARSWSLGELTLSIDEASHEARLGGTLLSLTPVEWRILEYLARNAGILVDRDRILGECLDYSHDGSDRTVITHLKNLRAKLGGAEWIETVRGFGYKFAGKPSPRKETGA
jgi:two-component system phosphate regulon response regulator PhoB